MLIIVMHNNRDYLEFLMSLVKKEDITNATIIEKKDIGTRLIGDRASLIFHRGNLSNAYDKAFISVIRDEEKVKHLLDLIENNGSLKLLNFDNKGFICAVPFQQVKYLELESVSVKKEEGLKMKIADYLREDRILLDLKSHNKEESIREISLLLQDVKEVTDFKAFIKNVFEREKMATTGIGHEIAIPHARTDSVKDFVIAFGRSPKGVEFNSLDGKPAKLIFLMGTPKEKGVRAYLKILAHLTRLLEKESFRDSLLNASTAKEVISIFQRAES